MVTLLREKINTRIQNDSWFKERTLNVLLYFTGLPSNVRMSLSQIWKIKYSSRNFSSTFWQSFFPKNHCWHVLELKLWAFVQVDVADIWVVYGDQLAKAMSILSKSQHTFLVPAVYRSLVPDAWQVYCFISQSSHLSKNSLASFWWIIKYDFLVEDQRVTVKWTAKRLQLKSWISFIHSWSY